MIEDVTRELEVNMVYSGTVTKIIESGCFVEIWSGCDGFIHISRLSDKRIEKVTDVVTEGDIITVKYLGMDRGKNSFARNVKKG